MPRLSSTDHRQLLDVLWTVGESAEADPFPEPALHALRALVPCDVVTYHGHAPDGEQHMVHVGQPLGQMTDELRRQHRLYDHQDPLRKVRGARKLTDYLTRRAYQRLELYQLVDRPIGVEFMMRLWLSPGGAHPSRLEFDRADRDFSERDRTVLDLLLPYLERHCARVAPRASARAMVTSRQRQILSLVAEGQTNGEIASALDISPETVRKHLENAYAHLGVHTRTAAVAALRGYR